MYLPASITSASSSAGTFRFTSYAFTAMDSLLAPSTGRTSHRTTRVEICVCSVVWSGMPSQHVRASNRRVGIGPASGRGRHVLARDVCSFACVYATAPTADSPAPRKTSSTPDTAPTYSPDISSPSVASSSPRSANAEAQCLPMPV